MNEKLSLTELQFIIRDSLYMALPDMYWVVAEISEIKENSSGHCYLELVEKHPDELNVRARIKAIIWSNRFRFLKSFFENSTGDYLREGLKILVKTKIEYHELYGLSLIITDIDPSFTVGELAMKRQQVINRLEKEGVFTMNKELDFPVLPQRIAIISSKNAAGYSDFINHIKGNNFGYVFYCALFDSVMQGTETEQSLISAFDKIMLYSHLFDLVVIIRGGGSQSDLSWFDSYNIAYHVTQFPLPVITGIGHDKDLSVTDMVAHKALKTPTAVADFLIESVSETENNLSGLSSEIRNISGTIIEKNRNRVESAGIKLLPLARIMLSGERDKLSGKIIEVNKIGKEFTFRAGRIPANHDLRLTSGAKSFLSIKNILVERIKKNLQSYTSHIVDRNRTKFEVLENNLNILNPENILLRGFTITMMNGRIIKSCEKVKSDDLIDTHFRDGTIRSKVLIKKG